MDNRRFINNAKELTSRIANDEITGVLEAIEVAYPPEEKNYPVDICLATNMISVGVDVPRLGLMVVTGQPKTTSEYIQVTGRIGRSEKGPGLVVVLYSTSKPRDRSHYEHFRTYHSKIYSQVEPTSVTPFSVPVQERALHAIMVGLIRYIGDPANRERPQPFPDLELCEEVEKIIIDKVKSIDPDRVQDAIKLIKEKFDDWKGYFPPEYGYFDMQTDNPRLMYPAGSVPHPAWGDRAWPTPTSMRNVDATCEADIIKKYIIREE
ncbi:MAG: helicase-related protein [Candidatus Eremiobacterota bacterium]